MKDKPLFELDNEYEITLMTEVLSDQGIPFRIDRPSSLWGGQILGASTEKSLMPVGYHYAMLWGYEDDAQRIGELLHEVRTAEPIGDADEWNNCSK